jgi:hypothetical protein
MNLHWLFRHVNFQKYLFHSELVISFALSKKFTKTISLSANKTRINDENENTNEDEEASTTCTTDNALAQENTLSQEHLQEFELIKELRNCLQKGVGNDVFLSDVFLSAHRIVALVQSSGVHLTADFDYKEDEFNLLVDHLFHFLFDHAIFAIPQDISVICECIKCILLVIPSTFLFYWDTGHSDYEDEHDPFWIVMVRPLFSLRSGSGYLGHGTKSPALDFPMITRHLDSLVDLLKFMLNEGNKLPPTDRYFFQACLNLCVDLPSVVQLPLGSHAWIKKSQVDILEAYWKRRRIIDIDDNIRKDFLEFARCDLITWICSKEDLIKGILVANMWIRNKNTRQLLKSALKSKFMRERLIQENATLFWQMLKKRERRFIISLWHLLQEKGATAQGFKDSEGHTPLEVIRKLRGVTHRIEEFFNTIAISKIHIKSTT